MEVLNYFMPLLIYIHLFNVYQLSTYYISITEPGTREIQ